MLPGQPEDRSPDPAALPEDPEDLYPGTAAERTRLAWERTAITFGVVGLVMLRDEPVAGLIVLAVTPLIWALARYVSAVPPDRPEDRSPAPVPALPEDPEDLSPGTAAERTRLAWERTAIAFGAVGLVMIREEPVAGALVLAATPLIWALGRYVSSAAPPQQRSRRLLLVTVAVTGVAVLAVVAAFIGHGLTRFR